MKNLSKKVKILVGLGAEEEIVVRFKDAIKLWKKTPYLKDETGSFVKNLGTEECTHILLKTKEGYKCVICGTVLETIPRNSIVIDKEISIEIIRYLVESFIEEVGNKISKTNMQNYLAQVV